MNIDRALKIRNSLKTRIADLYSTAKHCGLTSQEITQSAMLAHSELPVSTPQWVKTYIDGYRAALDDSLYADCLIFGGFFDGQFYSTYNWRDDYYGKHGIDAVDWSKSAIDLGHYWKESYPLRAGTVNRGTVKPYFLNTD